MEYIESAEYYHIQRNKRWGEKDNWEIGDEIEVGTMQNKLMESRFNTDYNMNPELDFKSEFMRLRNKQLDQIDIHYLEDMSGEWREYITKTREYIFEIERIQINSNLPSRFRCLFVTDLNGLTYWKPLLGNTQNPTIYKLSLSGRIHKANEKFVRLNTNSQDFNHTGLST
ncbi:DUF2441 domain-containing protein [Paenibacillus sp. FSL H7-0331]|uniref:DUF2441 domain-containing protein n=1 Tax=Paenibacillus sp. FSL H7-0331 TaxID=1920421 RepID=UPI00096C8CF6|nr:DUF2441 domain-containing protein [Paenibacillus sp. FSL H7-0331]OME97392.1 hypothetical protein BK127_40635 [Paenibacillus sp. FSL H7-0331]